MTAHASRRDYVVQTHPCSEVLAKTGLEARGFEVFLPIVREEIRVGPLRARRMTTLAPLFPGYLFVSFNIVVDFWPQINGTRGVKRILGEGPEHPTPLPDGALLELQARYEAGEFVRRSLVHEICAGDRVTVINGAFQGHVGICTASRAERVKVLLSRLFGSVPIDLPADMVAVMT